MTPGPIAAAERMNGLARRTDDKRLALVLTGASVAMVAMMAIREFHALMREMDRPDRLDRGRGR